MAGFFLGSSTGEVPSRDDLITEIQGVQPARNTNIPYPSKSLSALMAARALSTPPI